MLRCLIRRCIASTISRVVNRSSLDDGFLGIFFRVVFEFIRILILEHNIPYESHIGFIIIFRQSTVLIILIITFLVSAVVFTARLTFLLAVMGYLVDVLKCSEFRWLHKRTVLQNRISREQQRISLLN